VEEKEKGEVANAKEQKSQGESLEQLLLMSIRPDSITSIHSFMPFFLDVNLFTLELVDNASTHKW
jgi:ABC-type microcin C transport system permease subunit YejE